MRKKLSPKSIDALPPATAKRYEVRDDLVPGLMIRVSSTGGKVWYVSTRINERLRRIKIGSYPVIGLADARDKARDILRRIQLDEFVEETPEVPLPTFGETVPQFVELWSKPRNRTWRESQRMLQKFASLDHRPLPEGKHPWNDIYTADETKKIGAIIELRDDGALSNLRSALCIAAERIATFTDNFGGVSAPTDQIEWVGTASSRTRKLVEHLKLAEHRLPEGVGQEAYDLRDVAVLTAALERFEKYLSSLKSETLHYRCKTMHADYLEFVVRRLVH